MPIWEEAVKHFDEAELAALNLAIANINVWNRLNAAVRQPAGVWKALASRARNAITARQNSSGLFSNIQWRARE